MVSEKETVLFFKLYLWTMTRRQTTTFTTMSDNVNGGLNDSDTASVLGTDGCLQVFYRS